MFAGTLANQYDGSEACVGWPPAQWDPSGRGRQRKSNMAERQETSVMVSIQEILRDAQHREEQEKLETQQRAREDEKRRIEELRRKQEAEQERVRAEEVERQRRSFEEQKRQAELQAVRLRPPGEPKLVILPVAGEGEG